MSDRERMLSGYMLGWIMMFMEEIKRKLINEEGVVIDTLCLCDQSSPHMTTRHASIKLLSSIMMVIKAMGMTMNMWTIVFISDQTDHVPREEALDQHHRS